MLFQPNRLRCTGRFYLSEQSYSSVKMLIRKDVEIAQFGHVISSRHGDVTGWKRHQKLVAEIQLGNFFFDLETIHAFVSMFRLHALSPGCVRFLVFTSECDTCRALDDHHGS